MTHATTVFTTECVPLETAYSTPTKVVSAKMYVRAYSQITVYVNVTDVLNNGAGTLAIEVSHDGTTFFAPLDLTMKSVSASGTFVWQPNVNIGSFVRLTFTKTAGDSLVFSDVVLEMKS